MITTKQRSKLKSLSNSLKPLVTIGKEQLTPSVLAEIKNALFHRELVKVAALKNCETPTKAILDEVCNQLDCEAVLCVGKRFVVYKKTDKENFEHIL